MKKNLLILIFLASLAAGNVHAQQLWYDTMSTYPLGNITTNSSGLWINHSGNPDSLVVDYAGSSSAQAGHHYEVNQNRTGDVHRWGYPLTTNAITTALNGVAYASFIVSVTNMPANPNGAYFAHFMNTGTFFRGRVFTVVPSNPYPFTNSIPGTVRFGVANGAGDASVGPTGVTGGPTNFVPVDLALNTDYQVVVKVDAGNFTAELWVNPASESDTAVYSGKANDVAPYTNSLNAFAFRQNVGEGVLEVRDVVVGLTFADVVTNLPVTPIIGKQPSNTTNYSGNPGFLGVAASGISLGYQWYQISGGVTNTTGANSQTLIIPSLSGTDTADYYVVISNSGGSVTSQVAHIEVNTVSTPPFFTTAPQNTTNFVGDTATLSGVAAGTGPLTYQWKHYGTNVVDGSTSLPGDTSFTSGSTSPTLTIVSVSTNEAGPYTLTVTGATAPPVTGSAYLAVLPPRPVTIAFLRSLDDQTTWQTTDTTTLYSINGVITCLTNLSSGQSSYYIQDATGGLNLFIGGTTTFRPNIGDIVNAAGTLATFSDNLELDSSPSSVYKTHTIVGHTSVLPAPTVFALGFTNNIPLMETNLEGKVIMLTNIFFPGNTNTGPSTQKTITVTNSSGQSFLMFFPGGQDQDVRNRVTPLFAWSVVGVCNQFFGSPVATTAGYEILVSRWQDIQTNPPPAVTASISHSGNDVVITWTAAAPYSETSFGAYSYSVLAASAVTGPYSPLPASTGLTFANTAGTYTHTNGLLSPQKFYRVTSP